MDRELALMLSVSRRLPRIRGIGVVGNLLKQIYNRRPRPPLTDVDVLGFRMSLEPGECVDAGLLFYPQLYDFNEIAFLRRSLRPGDVFLDLGANIGFYSLIASGLVGPAGRVIAVEADPYNFDKLQRNIELNAADNITAVNVGLSDRQETLRLSVSTSGNRGGNTFLTPGDTGVDVPCVPLDLLMLDQRVQRIAGAKIDIEGFEYRVLRRFFAEAAPDLYPGFFILEQNPELEKRAGGDAVTLLREHGYRSRKSSALNYILVREEAGGASR